MRVRLRITGRVQGVWFRGSMAEEARRHGVTGWVRNRPDGSVEAEASGAGEALDRLVAWARIGPPAARVDDVTVETVAATGSDPDDFVIRR